MIRPSPGPRRAALAALLCLSLAACASDGNGGGGGTDRPSDPASTKTSDSDGAVLAKDSLQIVRIDRSQLETQGKVTYTVKNVSPSVKDLLWSVTFLYDPPVGGGEIQVDVVSEPSEEFALNLGSGEESALTVQSGAFASRPKDEKGGRGVRGTRLSAWLDPPVLAVARDREARMTGTKFVGGALECVALSSLWDDPTQLVVDLQNVSAAPVPGKFELVVIMEDTEARSKPVAIPTVAVGQTVRVTVDLNGVALGGRAYKLRMVPKRVVI